MTDDDELRRGLADLPRPVPSAVLLDRLADDAALEQAFASARGRQPRPSDLLMARIAQDARRRRPWIDRAVWGGMAAAGLVGLTVGLTGTMPDAEAVDLVLQPSYDFQLLDGE